ncbi:MAG: hypothetical protein ABR969_02865 [Sedimentisphaerales bacterium]|jgi:hypothetical protein
MAVTITYRKFNIVPVTVTWFNTEAAFKYATDSLFYIFRQSVFLPEAGHRCVKSYKSMTSIINLGCSQEELWQNLDPKSCRYEIRKVLKMLDEGQNLQVKDESDIEKFLVLANNYIIEKGYSNPLTLNHFTRYLDYNCGELLTVYYENKLLVGNFYIKDYPSRVRLLYSFNNRFEDKNIQQLSGAFTRYLHWYAMIERYKKQGFHSYDMGGVDLAPDAPTHGISKFKLSFGGKVVEEDNYVFVRNRLIEKAYKALRKIIDK